MPATGFTLNSWHVGAAAGGILLTFGIGQRVGAMRRDYRRRLAEELAEKRHSLQLNLDKLSQEAVERRSFEEKLVESLNELERSNEELEQFAYIASHDLQEPVRTVGGHLELFVRQAGARLPQRARDHVEEALQGTAQLQRHIDGLLEYSRITTQGSSFQRFDAASALDTVLARLGPTLEETKVEVNTGALPTLFADPAQVTRVLELLLENAVVFRGESPLRIHVEAADVEGDWVFSVRDNGSGIAESDRESVFDVFTRFSAKAHPTGIGMGLAIVRRIVERHHGSVWADGNAEGGATLFFSIPRTGGRSASEDGGES
jgi:light-regulated signal transduction histidine kinase (bacteriophytochrome)